MRLRATEAETDEALQEYLDESARAEEAEGAAAEAAAEAVAVRAEARAMV